MAEADGVVRLVMTCEACPEQYDAFLGDRQVGYLRLRHGHFRVDCPDCGGETVYTAEPAGDGIFEPDERDHYLRFAVDAILRWVAREASGERSPDGRVPAPDVEYVVDESGFW